MPRVVVEKGNDKGKALVLNTKSTFVFGRDTSVDFQIKDTMASRMHFKIESRADGYWLVDLESMNGTLLNQLPAKEHKLVPGDLIRVGETLFSYVSDEHGTDTLLNQKMGGYKVLERVGRGGMGTVYKAEQIDLQRIVALKIISEEHLKKKDFVELFVHEARAAAKLNHPNIVQVYDVKKHNDLYYFSMEFVPGGSVQEILNKQRKIPIDQTVRMILDAARGLEYAHKKEIIHRDVKPDNFMLGESGNIKIGDLGLAQRLGEKLSADDENSVIGTPHYIAPEQVLGRPADYRSDIYALGSTMYRMIAGFTPFQAPSVRELVNKKAREDVTPLQTACAEVPQFLGEICTKMMARLPEQRYQTMTEVIVDMEKYVRDSTGEVGRAAATAEVAVANKRLLLAAVGLLIIVVVGGVVGAMFLINKPPQDTSKVPPVIVDDKDTSEKAAEIKLDLAKVTAAGLDMKKPENIQEGIKNFEVVIERWPGTKWADEAAKHREDLKEKLRGLLAAAQYQTLGNADRAAWNLVLQSFQAGKEDLAEMDRSILAFRNFAQDPEWKGTPSAIRAEQWAQKILEWKAQVEGRRAALENIKAEAAALMSQRKFQKAWELYNRFQTETLQIKLEQRELYNTLLYNQIANSLQERIITEAKAHYYKVEADSQKCETEGDFPKAIEILESTIQDSTSEPRRLATVRLNELYDKWAESKRRATQLLAEELKRKEVEDLRDFDAFAAKWRKSVLALEARPAADDAARILGSGGPFPRLPDTAERMKCRLYELKLLADVRDTFIKAWNDGKISAANRKIELQNISGTIRQVTEKQIVIDLVVGGQVHVSFSDIVQKPEDLLKFHTYLKSAIRDGDARWNIGLVILCFEFGQFERALNGIETLAKLTDEDVKKFVLAYKPLAEELRYHDGDEIEAQKHYDRLETFMKDIDSAKGVEFADRELTLIQNRYSKTKVFKDHKSRIDEFDRVLKVKGGNDRDKKNREGKYDKIQKMRATVQGTIKAHEKDLFASISKIPMEHERMFHLGEAWMANRNLKPSTQTLNECMETLLKQPMGKRPPQDPALVVLGKTAISLMKNLVVSGQSAPVIDAIRGKVSTYLSDNNTEFQWWNDMKVAFDGWARDYVAAVQKQGKNLEKLEQAMQDNPDADTVWALAIGTETTRVYTEARGLYQALIEYFPDATQVKSGDALYRLAETTMVFRDIAEARKLYTRLIMEFPNHPKAKGRSPDSAESRLLTCSDLENKMGLRDK